MRVLELERGRESMKDLACGGTGEGHGCRIAVGRASQSPIYTRSTRGIPIRIFTLLLADPTGTKGGSQVGTPQEVLEGPGQGEREYHLRRH